MPNWATNTLVVEGLPEECERFALTHNAVPRNWKDDGVNDTSPSTKKKILEFSASVWDEDNKKHPYSQHGYGWCNENWGTKWGACETYPDNIEDILDNAKEGVLYYNFDTAWSPPVEWIEKVSRKFPHLKFQVEWAEEGGEGGYFVITKGTLKYQTEMTTLQWKNHMGHGDDDE